MINKHKFYSLEEKEYLESQAQNESEREELLSEFDKKNYKTINDIISVFRVYSDVDILRTTNYLSEFKKNLDWDGGFILRLISLSFYSLENTSVEQRKRILSSIIEILDNNKDAMNDNNSVEFYDWVDLSYIVRDIWIHKNSSPTYNIKRLMQSNDCTSRFGFFVPSNYLIQLIIDDKV